MQHADIQFFIWHFTPKNRKVSLMFLAIKKTTFHKLLLVGSLVFLPGCAVVVKKAGARFSKSLSETIMNHDDLATVKEAMPAYMLVTDSFVRRNPDSADSHATAASLYSAYANLLESDQQERVKRLSGRGRGYAFDALCIEEESLCQPGGMKFSDFEENLREADVETEILFNVASAWTSWIDTHQKDMNAIAQLPKAKALMARVLSQDPSHAEGQAQMYMGALESLVPPSAGGNLAKAKEHFENAISMSSGRNLMAKVVFADNYARMMFEKDLHDKLLNDVLKAEAQAEGFTLMNMLAKEKAEKLLASSDDYFL